MESEHKVGPDIRKLMMLRLTETCFWQLAPEKVQKQKNLFFLAVALTNPIATFSFLLPPLQVIKKTSARVNCWSANN